MRKTLYYGLSLMLSCVIMAAAPVYGASEGASSPKDEVSLQAKKTINGVVLDENGNPLAGATVLVKGSNAGSITDNEGRFAGLSVKETDYLEVSYLGYIDAEVAVKGKTSLTVTLQPNEAMEEVIVTGFQETKKESIVSAIETVNPKDLKVPSSNFTNALAGRVAGLISYQRSGEPGRDNSEFFIRGVTTFGYAQSPLIMVDGFETTSDALADIEPDNIESFSVLKDATAAALYGSKGANGVIVVTTKQGSEGKLSVSFRHESKISTPTQLPQTVDGVTYMKLYNSAQFNDNPLLPARYSTEKINNTINNVNPLAFPNVDWYDMMFKNATYNQHYTVNANGGGKIARYYMAVSYDKDTGILKENRTNNFKNNIDINRFNIMAKININLTRTTRAEVNMNSIFEAYTGPVVEATTIFNNVMAGNPVEFPAVWEPDAAHSGVKHVMFGADASNKMTNPYAEMVKGYKDGFTSNISSQFTLEQDLDFVTRGLKFRGKASIATFASHDSKRSYTPYRYSMQTYDALNDTYVLQEVQEGSEALGNPSQTRTASSKSYYELGLHYTRNFAEKHDVSAAVIYTMEEDKNTTGNLETIQASLPARNQGIRGRATYGYDGRYMAEFSLTYNGSEKFDESKRWGLFPAVGLGYNIANENWWEPLKKVFPSFKFKYSWGRVGNDDIASATERFFFLSNITYGGNGFKWGKDMSVNYGGFTIGRYANPDIQWEISQKSNYGIEFNLLGFADMQVEYFTENRSKIYMQRQNLPASMGLTSAIYGNLGEVDSEGIDASVDIKHDFNADTYITGRFNFTYAHAKTVIASEPDYKESWRSKVGYPVNQQWGLVAERLFIDEADVANAPKQSFGSTRPGDIKYKDINGDGQITSDLDAIAMGYPTTPEINYGFGISFGWKGLDISTFFQGQDRVSFFINAAGISPFVGQRNAMKVIADDHWSPDNPVAQSFWPRLSASNNANNTQRSTWWIRNGRIVRMKSLEVGYSLPQSVLSKTPLKLVRVYFSGSNLFKISDFDLWDPEMGSNGLGYPLQRVYSLGVQITF